MADQQFHELSQVTTWETTDTIGISNASNNTRGILLGDILPQAMGAIYVSTPAETSISDSVNYFKCAGTTTLNNSESVVMNVDMPANNRIRYTGTRTIHAHIACSISMTAAGSNKVYEFRIYKYDDSAGSGTTLVHSNVQRKVGAGTDVGSTALHADCLLDTNDYLELHVKGTTDTTNMTLEEMYLFFLGVRRNA